MPPDPRHTVDLQPVGRRVDVPDGTTVMEAARQAGIEIVAVCGGAGICSSCAVRIVDGIVSEITPDEEALTRGGDLEEGQRLACTTRVHGPVRVHIPPSSLAVGQRLQLEGTLAHVPPAPAVRIPTSGPAPGLAVDLGTTKLAGYLVDLRSGEILARTGLVNPQVAYGEDVVSRIAFANRSEEKRLYLGELLSNAVNELSETLRASVNLRQHDILDVVVAGNTAMHHLFTRLPVRSLGEAPYLPYRTEALDLEAASLGLITAESARVFVPPNIAGYVGADHVAMLLATDLVHRPGTTLALDIGTNTEISLRHEGHTWSCSCASGPAFEGAHIRDGCRAVPGAIDRVLFANDALMVHTIGGQAPLGICGSGILDAVAALRRAGIVEASGRMARQDGGHRQYVLSPAARNEHGRDLVVTREDVHQIQLAKAAIRTGIDVLLLEAGISASRVDTVLLAGAFGTYLDLDSAMQIGMLPRWDRAKLQQVGNAAGMGTVRMLLSVEERQRAIALAEKTEYIELTTWPGFQDQFVEALFLH